MKHNNEEYQIQVMVCEYLRYKHPNVLWQSDLGGLRLPIGLAVKAKKIRHSKGFPDIFIYEPTLEYHGLAIELKTRTGKQSIEQIGWLNKLENKGYLYNICYGYDDTIEAIEDYLNNTIDKLK